MKNNQYQIGDKVYYLRPFDLKIKYGTVVSIDIRKTKEKTVANYYIEPDDNPYKIESEYAFLISKDKKVLISNNETYIKKYGKKTLDHKKSLIKENMAYIKKARDQINDLKEEIKEIETFLNSL